MTSLIPSRFSSLCAAAALLIALPAVVHAQVRSLDLEVVDSPLLDGRTFGDVGAYERLRGIAVGELDPDDPQNRGIVNLDRAPRNAEGKVEYRTQVEILRPIDLRGWNGALYHTVPNRGRRVIPEIALLERGFGFVQVGWQGDIAPTETNIVAMLPVAREADGSPVTGQAVEEWIFEDAATASTGALTYPPATLDPARAHLTVRRRQDSPRETPDDLRWRYVNDQQVRVERPAGFDGGAIYEFVYTARDPIVMGIGFAAVRDVISFLRHREEDAEGNANPFLPAGLPRIAVSIGVSQSGRFLRDLLYQGFNRDLAGEMVFDGMHPDIAGSRKTFTNFPFSQPGRWQKQHEDHLYPGDQFPFTYGVLTDPLTGRTDGIFARCLETATCPRVVHTDGEAELWQARASLVVTDPAGNPIELPANVRAYLLAGTQHGGGAGVHSPGPRFGNCVNPLNPMPIDEIRTRLTLALYDWVADGTEPPPSRYPTPGNGLVPPDAVRFPDIPGVEYTGSVNGLRVMDHTRYPPVEGKSYPVFVGQVDRDGNMLGGVHHPNLSAPIGTYTGWNLRRDGFSPGEQCAGAGSFIPFAESMAERLETGDPRLSIEERYGSRGEYITRVASEANRLVREGYLLRADANRLINEALRSGVGFLIPN